MTDGHPCELSQRSVVGIGVAKVEVKDAENQYAWSIVNTVTIWDQTLWLRGLEGDANVGVGGLDTTARMYRTWLCIHR